ncbi:MAG: thioredoxin family protein [Hyphomicrobiaceae bacterium]|nr:MAG: thioredoxin family protein [Hyphomicrobiaceae bacterium]
MSETYRANLAAPPHRLRQVSTISRRTMILGAAAALTVSERAAIASEIGSKFTWEAFESAQKAGKPILLEIYAAWCPTCKVQRPIIEDLTMSARFKDVVYFEINFDKQKDVLRKFNVQKQATLIMFKGNAEVGRSIGDTDRSSIERLIANAL